MDNVGLIMSTATTKTYLDLTVKDTVNAVNCENNTPD